MDELRKILTHNAGRLPERLEQDVAAIIELIEGVIGEDEEPLTGKDVVFFALKHSIDGRNALRADQRQRLHPTQIKKEEK